MNDPADSNLNAWLTNIQQTRPIPYILDPYDRTYDYNMARIHGVNPAYYPGTEDILPDGTIGMVPHWDSRFKSNTHPNRYVDGVDTKTGKSLNWLSNNDPRMAQQVLIMKE